MIIDCTFRHGLCVGLEASQIIVFDDDTEETFQTEVWYLHLGPWVVSFIFGVDRSD